VPGLAAGYSAIGIRDVSYERRLAHAIGTGSPAKVKRVRRDRIFPKLPASCAEMERA